MAEVSSATATSDLAAAARLDLLAAIGKTRGRRFLPGTRFMEALSEQLNVPPSESVDATRAAIVTELSRRALSSP